MRTSALAAVLVASTALAEPPSRLEWGVGPEVTLMTFLPPQTAPWIAMLEASSSSI